MVATNMALCKQASFLQECLSMLLAQRDVENKGFLHSLAARTLKYLTVDVPFLLLDMKNINYFISETNEAYHLL